MSETGNFAETVTAWLKRERTIQSAVLFGSGARQERELAAADGWSDLDLHIVTSAAARLERVNWVQAMPTQTFCLQVVRPATGDVRKVTVLFAAGQLDLVLVPTERMRAVQAAMNDGLHRQPGPAAIALNEMATCLATGYRFLKGERRWGPLYARVVKEMPGERLDNEEICRLADLFLCELLWVLQKANRGEFAAAQHALHRSLAETNFRLLREWRLRCQLPLPSFGLARRVEALFAPEELSWVRIDARPERAALLKAAASSFTGLKSLMGRMAPAWAVPPGMAELMARQASGPH